MKSKRSFDKLWKTLKKEYPKACLNLTKKELKIMRDLYQASPFGNKNEK